MTALVQNFFKARTRDIPPDVEAAPALKRLAADGVQTVVLSNVPSGAADDRRHALKQAGIDMKSVDQALNSRVNAIIKDLDLVESVDETYLDMISFTPLYEMEVTKKLCSLSVFLSCRRYKEYKRDHSL